MNRLILASASPRRKELLEQIGYPFEIIVSNADESVDQGDVGAVVEQLSFRKAEATAKLIKENTKSTNDPDKTVGKNIYIIGADTVVSCNNIIMGKPKSEMDAEDMLFQLQGKIHQVYTGVTILVLYHDGTTSVKTFHEETKVTVYPMSREEILNYIRTGEPMDKAGAYGIQGLFGRYISNISGEYSNVVGLPIGRLYHELKNIGWK